MHGFLLRLRAVVDELRANPDVEVEAFEVRPPADPALLAVTPLTPEMRDFYAEANGFELTWRGGPRLADQGYVAGRVDLIPLEQVFAERRGTLYFDDESPVRLLRPVDFFVEDACAGLYLDGSPNPTMVFYERGDDRVSPLEVDFEGYLELLLKSRGFWYWQKALVMPERGNQDVPMSSEVKTFRSAAPRLFCGFDGAAFRLDVPPGGASRAHRISTVPPPPLKVPPEQGQSVFVRRSAGQFHEGMVEQLAAQYALVSFPDGYRQWFGFGHLMTA